MATTPKTATTDATPVKKVGWFGLVFNQAKEIVPEAGQTAVTSLKLANSGLNTALNNVLGMEMSSLADLADEFADYQDGLKARNLTHEKVLELRESLLKRRY